MARPPDATAPGWDALAPASGSDALAVAAADALSATSVVASADALAVGYRADALAVGYRADALAAGDSPATGDLPAAPVLGDTFGDSLTAYGDATAADRPGTRRAPGRRTPRPGPVPPAAASTDDDGHPATPRAGALPAEPRRTGPADAGRQPRRARPDSRPPPRRTARRRRVHHRDRPDRAAQPERRRAAGSRRIGLRREPDGSRRLGGRWAAAADVGRPRADRGAGSAGRRDATDVRAAVRPAAARRSRAARSGSGPDSPAVGEPDQPTDRHGPVGGPVRRVRLGRLLRRARAAPSGGSGKRPSGAEVARALLEAFRRSLRDR